MDCSNCGNYLYFRDTDVCWRCEEAVARKQQAINDFKQRFRGKSEIYLPRKVLAGRRLKLSLIDIAKALGVPIRDVEDAWNSLLQDAR